MRKKLRKTSAFVCAIAVMAVPMTFSSFVANAEGETVTSDYTLTIPATLAVENSGWNSIGDLTATGTLAQGKKLNVTATSENSWKLTSGENTVAYKLCGETEKEKTYADATDTTSLDISKELLEQTDGFSVPIGIVVEDYSTKPAGDYSDTVTFTAKVEAVIGKVLNFKHNVFGSASGTEEFSNGEKVALGAYGEEPTVYEKTGNQQWTGDPINWGTNDTLNLSAYYPTTDGTSYDSFTLPTDQSTLEKLNAADYMTGRIDSAPSYEDVDMTLEHKLAKVTVNVKSITGIMYDDEKYINNMTIFSGAESISDGNPSGFTAQVQPYAQKSYSTDDGYWVGSTFTAYVIPGNGDSGARFVRFSDGRDNTREVKGIPELEAGQAYSYDLIVSKYNAYLLPSDEPLTKITNITLANQTVKAGSTFTITPTVEPADATIKYFDWEVEYPTGGYAEGSNEKRATREIFAGNTPGTFNVRAYATDGSGVVGECTVTVIPAAITVTINQSDWGSDWNPSFTKDGVTVSAGMIDPHDGNLMDGGSFSTTLGNFTKIVVTTTDSNVSGTGWSGGGSSKTWAGTPASTVSFSGEFMGMGMTPTTIVCTIEPTN